MDLLWGLEKENPTLFLCVGTSYFNTLYDRLFSGNVPDNVPANFFGIFCF